MNVATNERGQPYAFLSDIAPGIALSAMLALLAFGLHALPGLAVFSPMIMAILLGIGFHNLVGTPRRAREGVKFSLRRILRLAIILLGLQLTAQQVVEVGGTGVAIIAVTLVATFAVTKWFGRVLGVDRKLAELIAAGTSICGASAVIATNTVTRAPDEDVAYAIACVTVFGSMAMFLYPALPALLHLTPRAYGLWAGASIHEIAQVVAAAFQAGHSAGEFGTIAKLTRVSMLAPVVITLGLMAARRSGQTHSKAAAPIPYFVLGFVALVILNSLVTIPAHLKADIVLLTTFLLSLSLAAMGLETDLRKLAAKGLRPLALGAMSWLFIATFSLGLVEAFG
ncbi:MAG TPA: YeiH family protein [Rhizomicrobium sp.]|nr:YeiH family protein [Rhizomicrobium sp.]